MEANTESLSGTTSRQWVNAVPTEAARSYRNNQLPREPIKTPGEPPQIRRELKYPGWGLERKIPGGLKTAGKILGGIGLGLLAIGLLPFTLTGAALWSIGGKIEMEAGKLKPKDFQGSEREIKAQRGQNIANAGLVIAFPLTFLLRLFEGK